MNFISAMKIMFSNLAKDYSLFHFHPNRRQNKYNFIFCYLKNNVTKFKFKQSPHLRTPNPGLTPPPYITNVGVNSGLNAGFGVLRCGPRKNILRILVPHGEGGGWGRD
jgi:hypothetical protein